MAESSFVFKALNCLDVFVFIFLFSFVAIAATKQDIYRKIKDSQRTINNVYKYLITHYVDDIDLEKFTKMSIDNMLSDLDPYTVYLVDDQKSGLDMLTSGQYGGVGIQIGKRDNVITVIAPTDDSPAKRAGIMAGDVLIKIDGEDTESMSMDDAAKLIRGKKGSSVVLTIERFNEEEPIDFTLTREDIPVKDVSYFGMLDENIGYIRLTSFNDNSSDQIKKQISKLKKNKKLNSFILDLRNNPGGLLSQAIKISDFFLENGEIVSTKSRKKSENRKWFARKGDIINGKTLLVLINYGSASASEIVAGALKDHKRAIIVGENSFGKGSVQSIIPLKNDGAIRLTVSKYYLPSGDSISEVGVSPDIFVAEGSDEFRIDTDTDNQLEFALKLLNG